MKLAAVHAIAELAKEPVPDVVNAAYKLKRTTFGRDYILPKALDPRLLTRVSVAVAKAAIESGVSRKTITDWEGYANHLREMMGYDNKLLRSFTDMAKANPKRVVFAEANHVNMLKAAVEAKAEGICYPILLGNEERLEKIAAEENLSLEGIEIVNLRHDREEERRDRYARILSEKRAREGVTFSEARRKDGRPERFRYDDGGNRRCGCIYHRCLQPLFGSDKVGGRDHRYPSDIRPFRCHEHCNLQKGYFLYGRYAD